MKIFNLIQIIKKYPKKTIALIIGILIIIFLLIPTPSAKPKIISNNIDKTLFFPDQSKLNIDFSQKISNKQKQKITIKTNPEFETEFKWDNNNLQITPKNYLQPNTNYSVSIFYKNQQIDSFEFKTNPYSSQEFQQQLIQQTQNDILYNNALKDLFEKYPWYNHMPIITENYHIFYDFNKNAFKIRLITETTEEIKQQALKSLEDINIDIKTQDYYFLEQNSQSQELIQE